MARYFKTKYEDMGSIVEFWTGGNKVGNCVRCWKYTVLDKHHTVTQSKGGKEKTVRLCRDCHRWVHDNIKEAEKEGFYIREYQITKLTRTEL